MGQHAIMQSESRRDITPSFLYNEKKESVVIYPLDIVYIKMSIQGKLLNSVREIPFKTSNNFPTRTLFNKLATVQNWGSSYHKQLILQCQEKHGTGILGSRITKKGYTLKLVFSLLLSHPLLPNNWDSQASLFFLKIICTSIKQVTASRTKAISSIV